MMFPLFSILRLEPHFAKPPQQFILLHLKRHHLMDWVRAVISVTLGVKPKHDLPPMIMQQETNSVWTQIREPFAACRQVHALGWQRHVCCGARDGSFLTAAQICCFTHQHMIRQQDTNTIWTQTAWCLAALCCVLVR